MPLEKVEGVAFSTNDSLKSVQASNKQRQVLTQEQRNAKRHYNTRLKIIESPLSQDDKKALLTYFNFLNFSLKDTDKETKASYKNLCLEIIKANITTNNNLQQDTKKFFVTQEQKTSFNNFIKLFFGFEIACSFNVIKKAVLSGYKNKLVKE